MSPFKFLVLSLSLTACAAAQAEIEDAPEIAAAPPVIYSNMEEVYFDREQKKDSAPWLSVQITNGKISTIDAYGKMVSAPARMKVIEQTGKELKVQLDERVTTLRRANKVNCWGAVKKDQPKADGSPNWHFNQKLVLHDQGGRTLLGGGETGAQETILRIRRVTWPEGSSNRPSLVLYVMKRDAPDRAISYSWADVEASRIGINLRWMQASCTIKDMERASEVSTDNFRG